MNTKIFLLAVAFATSTHYSWAQIKIGIRGGVDIARISFDRSRSNLATDNRTGFFIGPALTVKMPLTTLGLDLATLYSENKCLVNGSTIKFKTLEVPFNFRYSVGLKDIIGAYFVIGPQFDFNLGHTWLHNVKTEKQRISTNFGGGLQLLGRIDIGVSYNWAVQRSATYYPCGFDNTSDHLRLRNNKWRVSLTMFM